MKRQQNKNHHQAADRRLLGWFIFFALATCRLGINQSGSDLLGQVLATETSFVTLRKMNRRSLSITSSGTGSTGGVVQSPSPQTTNLASPSVFDTADSTAQPNQHDAEYLEDDGHSWIQRVFEEQGVGPSTIAASANKNVQKKSTNFQYNQQGEQQFPFSLIVGNDLAKQALILAAANPKGLGGGVLLHGGHGTGKSVLCRSMQRLLLQHDDSSDDTASSTTVPCITVPLHCQEDALLGTVDLERSMKEGVAVFEPGLLARADNGILYVDDIHLLDESLIHILLTAVTDGCVKIEREGVSVRYPCRPILLASYNPTEGGDELQQHWADRIAMTVPMTDSADMMASDRVRVVEQVEAFVDKTLSAETLADMEEEERELREAVVSARVLLPQVQLSGEQLLYLCQEASRADCEGQRAEIYAAEIARTSAALDGRVVVNANDLQRAVLLAIAPRARAVFDEQGAEVQQEEPDTMPEQSQPQATMQQQQQQQQPPETTPPELEPSDEQEMENEEMEDNEVDKENSNEEEGKLAVPDHFMFGVDAVSLDPQLLSFQQWTRKGKGGKRSKIFNLKRGRFIKALIPKDWKVGKIAVGATLRAAAPYQKIRRERAKNQKLVHVRNTDFRIKRMARKSGSLILFVVDSSGSMALNRMGAAKGAAMTLLKEAYKCRDKVCLISFHDKKAEVLVPPTKSMALGRSRLEAMPCGGKTPLAHALALAIRTGMNAVKVKQDVGKVVIVLLADGRANVPLCVSEGEEFDASLMNPEYHDASSHNKNHHQQPSRAFLKEEVLAIAKQLGTLKQFNLLCIDTEDKFVGTGMAKELTRVAFGTYFHLTPSATTAESVARIAQQGVNEVRGN
jgi:magnesium chelatase subunit D